MRKPWSRKEQEIIDLISKQDDASLEQLKAETKAEIARGNASLEFAFDRICREQARRTVEKIKNL